MSEDTHEVIVYVETKAEAHWRKRAEAAEAACTEMRAALEEIQRHCIAEEWPVPPKVTAALSSSCGRGWVRLDDPVVVGLDEQFEAALAAYDALREKGRE